MLSPNNDYALVACANITFKELKFNPSDHTVNILHSL
jgi:hypothetical protein